MKKYLRNNMNLFDKVEWVKRLASESIGVTDEAILTRMFRRLYRKGTGEYKKYGVLTFSKEELILDQLLKEYHVSPRTAYRWFKLIRAPQEMADLARQDKISQNELERRARPVLRNSPVINEQLAKKLMKEICSAMEVM